MMMNVCLLKDIQKKSPKEERLSKGKNKKKGKNGIFFLFLVTLL